MKMFPENEENELTIYEDDMDEDSFDLFNTAGAKKYETTIDEMIKDISWLQDKEELSFEDFAEKASLLTGAKRAKGNAKYLMTMNQVQELKKMVGGGTAISFYSIRETVHGTWVLMNGVSIADGTIGYLGSAHFIDVEKQYLVEFSA